MVTITPTTLVAVVAALAGAWAGLLGLTLRCDELARNQLELRDQLYEAHRALRERVGGIETRVGRDQ